ncbi:hypothetical protein [Pantoea sp. 18069]|uniref:hypothetical protein n=1 Tax=Pantoea sp. 18069 TaxID=2681415 RepID=UPI00135C7D8D|nr:hypothetical protein [Pantoea sp. 18069]
MNLTAKRKPLPLPGGHDKVLLHSCCASCSVEVMEAMLAQPHQHRRATLDAVALDAFDA